MAYKAKWTEYYVYLEVLRQSGIVNMFGAVPYLAEDYPELDNPREVLMSWMKNYDSLVDDGIISRD